MVHGGVEGLPVNGESGVLNWRWEEARHEGLQAHHGPFGHAGHNLHIAQPEEAVVGEQFAVLLTERCSIVVQLATPSQGGRGK